MELFSFKCFFYCRIEWVSIIPILSELLLLVDRMRSYKPYIVAIAFGLMALSCGIDGDPGHCYFAVDWEYYNEDHGVYYYEDNNDEVPDSDEIVSGWYYESYPGVYDYFYEAEDPEFWYRYNGFYELLQNSGSPGGLLHDGLDGADTKFKLFLYIEAMDSLVYTSGPKSAPSVQPVATSPSAKMAVEGAMHELASSGREFHGTPLRVETREWEQIKGEWTMRVEQTVRVYRK
jgi:hypothetical protein